MLLYELSQGLPLFRWRIALASGKFVFHPQSIEDSLPMRFIDPEGQLR
jgi:hypothetical protein